MCSCEAVAGISDVCGEVYAFVPGAALVCRPQGQLDSVLRDTVVGEGGHAITDTMDLGASFNDWPEASTSV